MRANRTSWDGTSHSCWQQYFSSACLLSFQNPFPWGHFVLSCYFWKIFSQPVFNIYLTGWPAGWREENIIYYGTVGGCVPFLQIRWWRHYYSRWRNISPSFITQSHSSLRPGPFWTCIWRRIGGRVQGCPIDGGIRGAWTWRLCGRRLRGNNG